MLKTTSKDGLVTTEDLLGLLAVQEATGHEVLCRLGDKYLRVKRVFPEDPRLAVELENGWTIPRAGANLNRFVFLTRVFQ